MFISINGQLGSGKSVVCDFLQKKYSFEVFSTGKIQRGFAISRGLSTLELNEAAKSDSTFDNYIDKALTDYAKANVGRKVVFDSRLAWHFIPDSFKVHLLINPSIAAKRVFSNRRTKEETYENEKDAMNSLIERRNLEQNRYRLLYGINMNDLRNYDLVLDTTSLSIPEMCKIVIEEYEKYVCGERTSTLIVSPKNIYPTEGIRNINMERVLEYKANPQMLESVPITLAQIEDVLFVMDGHHRIMAANLLEKSTLRAYLKYSTGDTFPSGVSAEQYVTVSLSDVYDWEDANRLRFGYYPSCIKSRKY